MFFRYKSNLEPVTLMTPRSTTGCWWIELLWLRLILIWIQPLKRKTPLSVKYVNAFPLQLLPPATKFGQGYVFTGICHSVNGRSTWHPPRPGADTPGTWSRHPPGPGADPLWDQVHPPESRHPAGPGTPPGTRYTLPDQVHHPPGPGTPSWDQVHHPGPGTPPGTRYTPWNQVHPLGSGTPPDQVHHPPGTRYTPPGTRYTPQTRYTPPPNAEHAGRYGQWAGGTHPTGMQSCYQ